MSQKKITVGVVFGSRSVEHDVSVVTATQIMKALNPQRYTVVPIYITRDGRWYTGKNLTQLKNFDIEDIAQLAGAEETLLTPNTNLAGLLTPPLSGRFSKNSLQAIDVIFPAIHGSHGEDGTLQGLCELANVAYVGTGVLASAIANDKAMTKVVLKAAGVPIVEPSLYFTRQDWQNRRSDLIEQIKTSIGFPLFIKPVTLGSSIGIGRAEDIDRATIHIDIALSLDRHVVVEGAVQGDDIVEINCAVLGNETVRASVLEQPISYKDFLDFEEKYTRKGGLGMKAQERIIPAPLSDDLTAKIKEAAIRAFQAVRGRGTARIDCLVNQATGEFWVNEINTMPGSLAFYLWEPEGLPPAALCDELIRLAQETHQQKQLTTYNYKSGLIKQAANRLGAKGAKL